MYISVIGCGSLGAVHAAAMASIGHRVVRVDVDARKIEALSKGRAPFFEPELQEILAAGIAAGNLRFTTDVSEVADAKVRFVTEWDEYRRHLLPEHASSLAKGRIVVDGRNRLDSAAWRRAGWTYFGMSRP